MNQWKTVYPTVGDWYAIDNLIDVSEIGEYVSHNAHRTVVEATTMRGYGEADMRWWKLTTNEAVRAFIAYLNNSVGTNLKLRMRVKRRHKLP